jgi:hypothetical protein
MSLSNIRRLLTMIVLGSVLVACTPVQPTGTTSAGTPSAVTTTEATSEATEEATEETAGEATSVATEEASEEATEESTAEATEEATEESSEEQATPVPDRSAVAPLGSEECEAIQQAVADALGVELTMEDAPFVSDIGNLHGTACTISATGTGEDFGNFVDVAQSIRDIFTAEGWTENQSYMADGPTGTASGYMLDNKLAIVSVDWEPSEEADCPDDQPIIECDVEPSQQLFTLVIELVELG